MLEVGCGQETRLTQWLGSHFQLLEFFWIVKKGSKWREETAESPPVHQGGNKADVLLGSPLSEPSLTPLLRARSWQALDAPKFVQWEFNTVREKVCRVGCMQLKMQMIRYIWHFKTSSWGRENSLGCENESRGEQGPLGRTSLTAE